MSAAIVAWMYGTGIALILALAALAAEGALRALGREGRLAWALAIGFSLAVPWLAWLGPATWTGPVPVFPAAVVPMELAGVEASAPAGGGPSAQTIVWILWAFASAAVALRLLSGMARLRAARAGWRPEHVSGVPVLVTEDLGPAVYGLHRASILLPAWALSMDEELRSLMLLHEREHVRAGDPWLLAFGLLAVVAMPWNPAVWVQLRRLRLAIEMDCDVRVLQRAPNPRAYGQLLLEVGRRHPPAMVLALSEPMSFLERRIRAFTRKVPHAPRKAFVLGSTAFMLGALAVFARDPLAPPGVVYSSDAVSSMSSAPTFTPYTVKPSLKNPAQVAAALQRNYPPLLRDAGIGGTTTMWFYIDEVGRVRKTQVARSSGYDALDDAAVRVADIMEFSPALNRDQPRPVWVQIPITFTSTGPADPQMEPSPREELEATPVPPPARGAVPPSGPHFTPYTRKPDLTNASEVSRALQQNYPPLLRDAGLGGTTTIWFHIGADGDVIETQVNASSGHAALDDAAQRVAKIMKFTPAMNRDQAVAVWVMIPITFSSR